MLTCPMCKKAVRGLARTCATCQTDLSLLVDYVVGLETGLQRADRLTRAGELGGAVWSYLEVLEVDPDNATARSQVGQVVAAVRQFDQTAKGRIWKRQVEREARARTGADEGVSVGKAIVWVAVVFLALAVGYLLGSSYPLSASLTAPPDGPMAPVQDFPPEP